MKTLNPTTSKHDQETPLFDGMRRLLLLPPLQKTMPNVCRCQLQTGYRPATADDIW